MDQEKDFDCVKMKNEIQGRLQEEWKGLSGEEIAERVRHDLEASDDPVARWWRRVRDGQMARRGQS